MVLEVVNLRKVKNNVYIFYIVLYTFNQQLNDPNNFTLLPKTFFVIFY